MRRNEKYFKQSTQERQQSKFSNTFKLKKVREIEQGTTTVSDVCQAYEVTHTSVYKWIKKYGSMSKPERTIVESKSDTTKILALQKRIAELERLLGQKQIEIEFKDKMIELAEQTYGVDIKKKSGKKRWFIFGSIELIIPGA